ncbi:MAG: T9SS type A sorting domain-containing protein [Bacteroidetes bacterium]|nr:T9SS type A sorting domain-containing protein [Bacteroidota bacterium]
MKTKRILTVLSRLLAVLFIGIVIIYPINEALSDGRTNQKWKKNKGYKFRLRVRTATTVVTNCYRTAWTYGIPENRFCSKAHCFAWAAIPSMKVEKWSNRWWARSGGEGTGDFSKPPQDSIGLAFGQFAPDSIRFDTTNGNNRIIIHGLRLFLATSYNAAKDTFFAGMGITIWEPLDSARVGYDDTVINSFNTKYTATAVIIHDSLRVTGCFSLTDFTIDTTAGFTAGFDIYTGTDTPIIDEGVDSFYTAKLDDVTYTLNFLPTDSVHNLEVTLTGDASYSDTIPGMLLNKMSPNSVDPANILFNIYPNPVSQICNISFMSLSDQKASIVLYDFTGKKIFTIFNNRVEKNQQNHIKFDVSDLTSGIYFVKVTSESSEMNTVAKVIIFD